MGINSMKEGCFENTFGLTLEREGYESGHPAIAV